MSVTRVWRTGGATRGRLIATGQLYPVLVELMDRITNPIGELQPVTHIQSLSQTSSTKTGRWAWRSGPVERSSARYPEPVESRSRSSGTFDSGSPHGCRLHQARWSPRLSGSHVTTDRITLPELEQ